MGIFVVGPARAGRRDRSSHNTATGKGQPRIGGETVMDNAYLDYYYGLPLQMQGKVAGTGSSQNQARITTAYARKKCSFSRLPSCAQDHSHICGNQKYIPAAALIFQGSPLQGQRKFLRYPCWNSAPRITPAYAGKNRRVRAIVRVRGEHPRHGGEKQMATWLLSHASGLPPLTPGSFFTSCA